MTVTTARAAAAELLARRRARESLADYVEYLDLGFAPAAHHRLLIAALEEVERGECPRLMLFLPPGSAKSTYASQILIMTRWHMDDLAADCSNAKRQSGE